MTRYGKQASSWKTGITWSLRAIALQLVKGMLTAPRPNYSVRTYDLDNPWLGGSRIKDHITGVETTDAAAVLDRGELDEFVGAGVRKR